MSGLYQRTSQSVGSLLDTDLTNPVNDDVLTYENELWKNKPVASSNTPVYASSYLSNTNIDQTTSSTSTFYRVGHTTPFLAEVELD